MGQLQATGEDKGEEIERSSSATIVTCSSCCRCGGSSNTVGDEDLEGIADTVGLKPGKDEGLSSVLGKTDPIVVGILDDDGGGGGSVGIDCTMSGVIATAAPIPAATVRPKPDRRERKDASLFRCFF